MAINIELAERVLDAIARHPERHNQYTWRSPSETLPPRCKTTMCIGGWAGFLEGGVWVSDDPENDFFGEFLPTPADHPNIVHEYDGLRWVPPEDRAQRVLNLTNDQANPLFYNCDNEEALAYLRELIAEAKSVEAMTANPMPVEEPAF